MNFGTAIEQLRKFVEREKLFQSEDKLLLAVSGGCDSMCMLELIRNLHPSIEVAHVNYRLRGSDSDADAGLVEAYCSEHDIRYHLKRISDEELLSLKKGNLQAVARDIRYAWFESLIEADIADLVATAHHADDAVETFLLQALRGAGVHGLSGIPVRRGRIIRPMLCLSRNDIEALTKEHDVPFRIDASNLSLTYLRNRLRHLVIPTLQEVSPDFKAGLLSTMGILRRQQSLIEVFVRKFRQTHCSTDGQVLVIDLVAIQELDSAPALLAELVRDRGFTYEQCEDIIAAADHPGKFTESSTHTMAVDRDSLHVWPRALRESTESIPVRVGETIEVSCGTLRISQSGRPSHFPEDRYTEYIPLRPATVEFTLRSWRAGDRFVPLGMNGTQKLQDFFVNEKVPLSKKENIMVLTSEDEIVWVVGFRLDERWKVGPGAKDVLKLEFLPKT